MVYRSRVADAKEETVGNKERIKQLEDEVERLTTLINSDPAVWRVPEGGRPGFTCTICSAALNHQELRQDWEYDKGRYLCPPCFEKRRSSLLVLKRERDEALHEARANAELVGKQTAKLASALADKQEALAQVAVLCSIGDQIVNRWWNAEGIKTLTDEDANPLSALRAALMLAGQGNVIHEARALLDRLQRAEASDRKWEEEGDTRNNECIVELTGYRDYLERQLRKAEAVVEALAPLAQHDEARDGTLLTGFMLTKGEYHRIKTALAAWEEGTA